MTAPRKSIYDGLWVPQDARFDGDGKGQQQRGNGKADGSGDGPGWDRPGGPEGPEGEAREPDLSSAEPVHAREPYGPPTVGEFAATMDDIAFERVAPDWAAQIGISPTKLGKVRSAAKAAAAKAARAAEKAAKAQARAEADAAKEAEKAAEKAAKEQAAADAKAAKDAEKAAREAEREAKARERRKRLDDQKAPPPLVDDVEDPLHKWTPPHPDNLPEITVAGGERTAIADAILAHMKTAGVPFYQRGKELVRVNRIKLKQSDGKTVLVPAISIVTKPMLLRAFGLCATWWAYTKDLDLVRIDPPSDLADHVLGMLDEWPFATLRGISATPTMRYDGTLLTKPGYDRATGLVLFNPPKLPTMPDQPTKQDALDALAYLNNNLLVGFDFAEDDEGNDNLNRACAMSMLMTAVLRGMMPAAPIHFITKPDAGSGGSYMQDLMSAIALGERCPTISLTLNDDLENEKRLSSAGRSGQPIIAIDNFTGTLMGNFFCQLIERPWPQIRILGLSEMVTIPNGHFVVANGINIAIGTDAIRRGVRIELDPNTENPESRTFTSDPVAEVLADRGPAVAAILTIARAWRLAGMPEKQTPRPSFGEWSDNVRSALVWLGWPDVDESIKTARGDDPHHNKLVAVMDAWAKDLTVGIGYRVSDLVTEASAIVYPTDGSGGVHNKPDLWDALFDIAGNRTGQLDPTKLGNWLNTHKKRVIGKHKLINDTTDKSRPKWKLVL